MVRNAQGVDEWVFQGEATSTPFGMAATVGWPREEWGFNPGAYAELRPGCFDVHERVRDMNANGVLASMNFPTMAGFNARTFTESSDKEIALVMLRAYNDWAIDEWCGAYPGRFIPLGIVPMWDIDLAVEEVHRLGEGLPVDQLPRDPARAGLPELPVGLLGPDARRPCATTNMVLSLHIGAGFDVIRRPAGGAGRPPHGAGLPDQRHHRPGPALRPDAAAVPRPAGGALRGRDRLDPLLLRPDRPALPEPGAGCTTTTTSAGSCRPRCSASTSWPATSPTRPGCCCATGSASTTSPGSATTPTPTRPGPSRPSSPGGSSRTPAAPTRRSTRSPGRTPAASSGGTRSPTPREPGHGRGAAGPGRRRRHHPDAPGGVAQAQRGRRHRHPRTA